MTDTELIDLHGGPTRLAKKLGWSGSGAVQRIHNWRTRGIPSKVKLDYPWLNTKSLVCDAALPKELAHD